ncbi:MAG: porin [Pseudomonadota bacterium]
MGRERTALLTATSVACAVFISAGSVAANQLEASLGGKIAFGALYNDGANGGESGPEFLRDGEFFFKAKGQLDNGLQIEGRVELEGFTATDQIDENWVRLRSDFGEVLIGGDDTAADKHREGWFGPPEKIIGYFNSDISDFEPSTEGDDISVRYTTPRIRGFQAAVSYGIDGTDGGGDAGRVTEAAGPDDIISVGASYRGEFGPVAMRIGGGYVTVEGDPFSTWTIGGEFYVADVGPGELGLAVHYDDNGSDGEDAIITGGLQYEFGPWTVAGGTTRELSTGTGNQTYAAWVSYALAPGVTAVFGYEGNNIEDPGIDSFDNIVGAYIDLQF